jgi:D-alanyl-lipoteichoic acid acyltransferase DltB (MBOAT superfamily)
MLFNSLAFSVFLPVVFTIYWLLAKFHFRWQNVFILIAGYVFYGWWDWRFLSLLAFSSTMDYTYGRLLGATADPARRKAIIIGSIITNLGLLGIFKYYNFFIGSLVESASRLGIDLHVTTLSIVLPVGISFYTFQSLSYTLDVYRNKLPPVRNMIDFLAFVSFFPQLLAGPIERATRLLPLFCRPRTFDPDAARDGLRQMLWGFFKKIVIADNCATCVNRIFANPDAYPASVKVVGAVYFAFQIYCDFSGYSDIAIGCARLFGFTLMRNFAFPYYSRDIAEFWRRWHISLTSWFRDYLYIPLGGSRSGRWVSVRNVLIVFLVCGLWHGANWTFVIWGLLNGLYFVPLLLLNRNRAHLDIVAAGRWLPGLKEVLQMALTFMLTLVAWVFFRAATLKAALHYLHELCSPSLITLPKEAGLSHLGPYLLLMLGIEWFQRERQHGLQIDHIKSRALRWLVYYAVSLDIFLAGGQKQAFIYFQF